MCMLFMVHFKSFNYWYWGFLVLIVVLFYVVNCLTPLFSDDWHYCMMIGPNGEEDRWIENLRDVLVSNYYHYFQVNGRFIPHFFLMTFDALLGKQWFNVFNALLFGLYLHLLNLNFVKDRKNALMGLAISASLTLCLMCGFRNEFLWMSGVFNYEFVAVLVLLFNYLLNIEMHSKWWMPLLFLYGVVCGWTNEAVVIGLACVYLWMYAKCWRKLKMSQMALLSGFVIGVAFCVFSPGSIHRALDKGGTETIDMAAIVLAYVRSLFCMYNLRVFFAMVILWILVKRMEWTWSIGVVFSILFVAFTGHGSVQSRFGIELFSLIIVLCVFPYEKMNRYVGRAALSLVVVYLFMCMPYCVQNYQEFKCVEKQIKGTKDGIILTNEVHPPFLLERMVQPFLVSEKSGYYFMFMDWYNSMLPRYYGRQDVDLCFLPEKFVFDVRNGSVGDTFDVNTAHPFYTCRWKRDDQPASVKFLLDKSRWASYPILGNMERFSAIEIMTDKWVLLEIEGLAYLLVEKNSMIQNRLKTIEYE